MATYQIDNLDRVVPLAVVPSPAVPSEASVFSEESDETTLRYTTRAVGDGFAVVRFEMCLAHTFGPPNDEAMGGHPLSSRGLQYYAAAEVLHSSWVRALEVMNRVHPSHRPEHFLGLRHFVFTFKDKMFECAAKGLSVRVTDDGVLSSSFDR